MTSKRVGKIMYSEFRGGAGDGPDPLLGYFKSNLKKDDIVNSTDEIDPTIPNGNSEDPSELDVSMTTHRSNIQPCARKKKTDKPRRGRPAGNSQVNDEKRRKNLEMNQAFAELKAALPNMPENVHVPKLRILRSATQHIRMLHTLIENDKRQK